MSKLSSIDRQREHQANERTFLAWLRTSISLIGFGFAIARFGIFVRQLETSLRPTVPPAHPHINSENLGVGLVIFGIIVIGVALWSYNRAFWQIERGAYRPNRLMIWITSIAVIILGILSLSVMVRHEPLPEGNPSKSAISFQNLNASTQLPTLPLVKGRDSKISTLHPVSIELTAVATIGDEKMTIQVMDDYLDVTYINCSIETF